MATFRTASITAEKRTKRISLTSLSLLTSVGSSILTTTNGTRIYPVPLPFATSRGSNNPVPRPRRGAPPVAPAMSVEERKQKQGGVLHTLRRVVGLKAPLHPALCEGW
ncbi:hypothetical protein B0H12DRAFT_136071 [Mycena haematopus]|nr:hypothetical protein B0H12DRAFT_136071 [Mycena haematopus]